MQVEGFGVTTSFYTAELFALLRRAPLVLHDRLAFLGTGRLSSGPPPPPPAPPPSSDKLLKLSKSTKINKKIRLHFPLKTFRG